jgi:hypothetical protein
MKLQTRSNEFAIAAGPRTTFNQIRCPRSLPLICHFDPSLKLPQQLVRGSFIKPQLVLFKEHEKILFGNTIEPTRVVLSLVPEISIGVDDYATPALGIC